MVHLDKPTFLLKPIELFLIIDELKDKLKEIEEFKKSIGINTSVNIDDYKGGFKQHLTNILSMEKVLKIELKKRQTERLLFLN